MNMKKKADIDYKDGSRFYCWDCLKWIIGQGGLVKGYSYCKKHLKEEKSKNEAGAIIDHVMFLVFVGLITLIAIEVAVRFYL